MADFSVCHGGWIAVCDGSKAMLLENKGDRFNPKLEMLEVAGQENPPTHSQGSSPPGRTISSADGRRAAMEETDFHAQAEEVFLLTFAANLNQQVQEREIRGLLLIAPAKALGILRKGLSDAIRKILSGELVRDYVKMPLHEIERHLTNLQ